MDAPRIQYATARDGVNIAYVDVGDGEPFVWCESFPYSHVQLFWDFTPLYGRIAQDRRFVDFDNRGCGNSQRGVTDISLSALVSDLEAVVDQAGLDSFTLLGEGSGSVIAISYAVAHPERISSLIIRSGGARMNDFNEIPRVKSLLTLLNANDWDLYTEAFAGVVLGFGAGEQVSELAQWFRECTEPATARAFVDAAPAYDVTQLLPQVRARTMILHARHAFMPTIEMSRELAAGIPGAQLQMLEAVQVWGDDIERGILDAVNAFLPAAEPARVPPSQPSGTAIVLFTDLASSTALTQRLGDAKAQELVRAHNVIVREALKANGGSEIKHTGDGIMASFGSASAALECAIAIQRSVALRQAQGGDAESLAVHIGLNAGEPVAEEGDLFGTAVQLARRICDHAGPGQILVPDAVRHLVGGKDFLFSDVGDVLPKGFDEAVRLYEVRWRDEGP